MPTTPNPLAAIVAQPLAAGPQPAKTVVPGAAADTDFRQALAVAAPISADASKAATLPTADSVLTPAAAPVVATVSGKSQIISKNCELNQPGGKRMKKAGAATAPAAAAEAALVPRSPAAMIAASAAPGSTATTVTPEPATVEPGVQKPPAQPVNGSHRPAVITYANLAQNIATIATPIKTFAVPQSSPVIAPAAGAVTTSAPSVASHMSAKSAEITRQFAAALPLVSTAVSGATPALHISLHPETLGTITVKIVQHTSGETAVTISANQPETLAALKHDASNLNQVLTNAGVAAGNRQLDFQAMPVAAPQISTGLGSSGQSAGGQSAGQPGQPGQNNGSGQQLQQNGTGFALSVSSPSTTPAAQYQILSRGRTGVDVIA